MKTALVIFGILATVFGGLAVLVTAGEVAALLVVLLIVGAVVAGFFVNRTTLRALVIGSVVVFLAGTAFIGVGVAQLISAFGTTDGPVDPPDPAALAAADAKVDAVRDSTAFRLELTEGEMTAYVLDGLQGVEDNPLRSVALDVVDGERGDPGRIEFDAEFKGGGIGASGFVMVVLDAGRVEAELGNIEVGAFDMPGLARSSLEDLVERVADFNQTLDEFDVDVQSVELASDTLVITGTQLGTDLLTSQTLLSGLSRAAASAVDAVAAPPERLGPGDVDSTRSGGSPVYVALGDSLAANVGVDRARDGYVSRFHRQLQLRDNAQYGLRNFGISGETTGTLIRGGQLDEAIEFMEASDVAYVTIDIGANNLLGHLGSESCSQDLADPECRQRIEAAFQGYGPHMELILERITEAAPDATVIFLTAYNPFSLGLGTALEAESDATLTEFNAIAAGAARSAGVLVADGFTPMQKTAGSTTHMLDAQPDIHPIPIGYDILAGALVDALN